MPYTLNGIDFRLNRMERQFIYAAFTLPPELKSRSNSKLSINCLLRHSDIKDGKIILSNKEYNIIWLDFPEKCISNQVDISLRDFSEFGIPPLALIRNHKFY